MVLKWNKDVLIGGCLFVVNSIYFYDALKLPMPFEDGEPGPAFVPLVLAAILFLSSIMIMVSGFKKNIRTELNLKDVKVIRPLLMMVATGIFVLFFEPIGYWIATLFYTFSVALIFDFGRKDNLGTTIAFCSVISVVITLAGWLFFDLLFDLHLPKGVI